MTARRSTPISGLLVSEHWDSGIGEIGVLLDASFSRNEFNRPVAFDDNLRSTNHGPAGAANVAAPSAAGGLNQFGHYERPQVNLQLQWKPTPELEIYGEGMFVGYRARSSTSFILNDAFSANSFSNVKVDDNCNDYQVGGDGFHNSTGAIEHLCNAVSFRLITANAFTSNQAHDQRTNFYLAAGGVKYDNDRFHANLDASYEYSIYSNRTFIIDIGKRLPTLDVTTNDNGGINYNAPGNPLGNPNGFSFVNGLDQDFSDSIGQLYALKGDAQYDFDGILQNIQVGARVAKRDVTFRQSIVNPAASKVADPLLANNNLPAIFWAMHPAYPRMNGGARFVIPRYRCVARSRVQYNSRRSSAWRPACLTGMQRTYVAGEKTWTLAMPRASIRSISVARSRSTVRSVFALRVPIATSRHRYCDPACPDADRSEPHHIGANASFAPTSDTDVLPKRQRGIKLAAVSRRA